MTVHSVMLAHASVCGVAGGIYIASTRFPVGPNLLQIFARVIGLAAAAGFIVGVTPYLLAFFMPHTRFGINDVVCITTMICVGWLTAGVITGIASIILKSSYS